MFQSDRDIKKLFIDPAYLYCIASRRHLAEYPQEWFCAGESHKDPTAVFEINFYAIHIGHTCSLERQHRNSLLFIQNLLYIFFLLKGKKEAFSSNQLHLLKELPPL